jgi:hypothetical protein
MSLARVFTVAAACVALAAAAAACSGGFGSGSAMPNAMGSPSFGNPTSAASAAPISSNAVLTYGESTAFQTLPEVNGYSGAIAFPKAPEPTPAPPKKGQSPGPAPAFEPVSIGATLYVKKPEDGPDVNFEKGKGKHRKTREKPARAIAWIELLPTHDATLPAYPRISLDVPRELAAEYRDGEFGIALWNSGEKDSAYRLGVESLDQTSTPPPLVVRTPPPSGAKPSPGASGSPRPGAMQTMMPFATPSASPSASPSPGALRLNGMPLPAAGGIAAGGPSAAPTLPPARMLFVGGDKPLKLVANRPAIFLLYALPHPSATPEASPKAGASATPAAGGKPGASAPPASPKAGASAIPAGSPKPSAAASAAP